MTQHNNYHPCTSILIEALRNMEGGDKVLKEWDKQRQIVDSLVSSKAKADSESILKQQQNTIAVLKDEITYLNEEQARLNRWLDSNRVWFKNSNKEIEGLKASNELLHDALESNQISEKELLSYIEHINVLREALEDIVKTNASTHGTTQMMLAHCIKSANEVLALTPELKGLRMKFDIIELKELPSGGAELIVEMDDKTKQYLLNYAILDILKNQLNEIDALHKQED